MRSAMTQQSNQSFNPEYFENLWNGYADEDYDVVIIGGGSVGAGAAADAATLASRPPSLRRATSPQVPLLAPPRCSTVACAT